MQESVPVKVARNKSCVSTAAMLGFIVGLGDIHGRNILNDEKTGECEM